MPQRSHLAVTTKSPGTITIVRTEVCSTWNGSHTSSREALRDKAGLDPEVAPAAQLAGHQYSSGKWIVVTDLSAYVMTQTRPSPIP
jgi:hypothetical protein